MDIAKTKLYSQYWFWISRQILGFMCYIFFSFSPLMLSASPINGLVHNLTVRTAGSQSASTVLFNITVNTTMNTFILTYPAKTGINPSTIMHSTFGSLPSGIWTNINRTNLIFRTLSPWTVSSNSMVGFQISGITNPEKAEKSYLMRITIQYTNGSTNKKYVSNMPAPEYEILPASFFSLSNRNQPGGLGQTLKSVNLTSDETLVLYSAGYDRFGNFISDQESSWTLTNFLGSLSDPIGIFTVFSPSRPGIEIITSAALSISQSSVTCHIVPGSLDYIKIKNLKACKTNLMSTSNFFLAVNTAMTLRAFSYDRYNNTIGCPSVYWSASGNIGFFSEKVSSQTVFTITNRGWATLTAVYSNSGTVKYDASGLIAAGSNSILYIDKEKDSVSGLYGEGTRQMEVMQIKFRIPDFFPGLPPVYITNMSFSLRSLEGNVLPARSIISRMTLDDLTVSLDNGMLSTGISVTQKKDLPAKILKIDLADNLSEYNAFFVMLENVQGKAENGIDAVLTDSRGHSPPDIRSGIIRIQHSSTFASDLVRCYPNPANKKMTLSYPAATKDIKVFSLAGNCIRNIDTAAGNAESSALRTTELSGIPAGIYFVIFYAGNKKYVERVQFYEK